MRKLLAASAILGVTVLTTSPVIYAADETRRVEGLSFNEVLVLGSAEVEISQGDAIELQLRGPADELERQPFYVKRDTLVLGARSERNSKKNDDSSVRFRVVMPALEELTVKGSGEIYLKPFVFDSPSSRRGQILTVKGSGEINAFDLQGTELEVRVEGSGDIRVVSVDVDDFEAVVAGSGNLFIETVKAQMGEFVVTGSGDLRVTEEGFVEELEVNVVGSGDIRMSKVNSLRAETNIVGSGSASIGDVREQLNASILGSGDVSYSGAAEVERVELGSGEVRRRD